MSSKSIVASVKLRDLYEDVTKLILSVYDMKEASNNDTKYNKKFLKLFDKLMVLNRAILKTLCLSKIPKVSYDALKHIYELESNEFAEESADYMIFVAKCH